MLTDYRKGDRVTLKKGHPCGANEWEVVRTGADFKLRCVGCDRTIWMSRMDFLKRVRKIHDGNKFISVVHFQRPEEDEERPSFDSEE